MQTRLSSHESYNCGDFDNGQHELRFAVTSDAEKIDADNEDKKDGDPGGRVNRSSPWPVGDRDRGGHNFKWQCD